ncbi:MAG: hypothetical protein Kow0022_09700 [Phycisphaerales bacterium]
MTRQLVAAILVLLSAAPLSHAQEHMFRTWFEAPESVMAGETFQVWMWATYEIDGQTVPGYPGYFWTTHASTEVTGPLDALKSISPVLDGLYLPDPGTPDGNWLRDFIVFQVESPGFHVDYGNPLRHLMFEITTVPGALGQLELHLRAPSDLDVPFLSWLGDHEVATTSYGSSVPDFFAGLQAESFTVRVIPAPASLALLMCAWLPLIRRQR